jgi:adenylate cyclase class IV
VKQETKIERFVQDDKDMTQEVWEEVTGMAYLLSDACDFLDNEQKDRIRQMSGYEGNDWQKVMYVARKLLRDTVSEWSEEVKEEYWHYKGRGLNQKSGYLGVRIRPGVWINTIAWFRFRKHGEESFSENIAMRDGAKKISIKQVQKFAKPRELEGFAEAEKEFVRIRCVHNRIRELGYTMQSIERTLASRDSSFEMSEVD